MDLQDTKLQKVMNFVHEKLNFGYDLFIITAQRQLANGYVYKLNYEHAGQLIQVIAT